jgi:hypothetical protein
MAARSLAFSEQEKLLSACAELAENMHVYSACLQDYGYKSFLAWEEFEITFCEDAEIEEHMRCVVARAKRRIGSPDGLTSRGGAQKSQNGHCPCSDRLSRMERESRDYVEASRGLLLEKFLKYREYEARSVKFERYPEALMYDAFLEYRDLFELHLVDAFRSVGFRLDERRSSSGFLVISKPLADGWEICWSPESNRTLRWAPRERSTDVRKMSVLDLRCYARAVGTSGSVSLPLGFKKSSIVKISIGELVSGFDWAYSRFNGIEELAMVLSAHACLYRLVGEPLEDVLRRGLECVDSPS